MRAGTSKKKVNPTTDAVAGGQKSWNDVADNEKGNGRKKGSALLGSKENKSAVGGIKKKQPESSDLNAHKAKVNPGKAAPERSKARKRKKTGLFGQRRRRNRRGLNAKGQLVGAAAAAHHKKQQKGIEGEKGFPVGGVDNEEERVGSTREQKSAANASRTAYPQEALPEEDVTAIISLEPMAEEPLEIISLTQTVINSSTVTLTSGAGQSGQTSRMETGGNSSQVGAGQKRSRGDSNAGDVRGGGGVRKLFGAAAEAKKGRLMGVAAAKHAEKMEQQKQKESSPAIYRRSTEPHESIGMNLRSSDRQLRTARQMRSI